MAVWEGGCESACVNWVLGEFEIRWRSIRLGVLNCGIRVLESALVALDTLWEDHLEKVD